MGHAPPREPKKPREYLDRPRSDDPYVEAARVAFPLILRFLGFVLVFSTVVSGEPNPVVLALAAFLLGAGAAASPIESMRRYIAGPEVVTDSEEQRLQRVHDHYLDALLEPGFPGPVIDYAAHEADVKLVLEGGTPACLQPKAPDWVDRAGVRPDEVVWRNGDAVGDGVPLARYRRAATRYANGASLTEAAQREDVHEKRLWEYLRSRGMLVRHGQSASVMQRIEEVMRRMGAATIQRDHMKPPEGQERILFHVRFHDGQHAAFLVPPVNPHRPREEVERDILVEIYERLIDLENARAKDQNNLRLLSSGVTVNELRADLGFPVFREGSTESVRK